MAKITVKNRKRHGASVEGIPTDVTIEVHNYDVSGVDGRLVTRDQSGKSCEIGEWHAPE